MTKTNTQLAKATDCRNCGSSNFENYCANCGQRNFDKRFTVKVFYISILQAFNIEKGIFYTGKMLLMQPGVLISDYLSGKTRSYFNPLKYLILTVGVFTFIMLQTGVFDSNIEATNEVIYNSTDVMKEQKEIMDTNPKMASFNERIVNIARNYFNLIPLLMIPFTSWVTKWFYRKRKMFYGEYLIINSYLFAQSYAITLLIIMPLVLIFKQLQPHYSKMSFLIAIVYFSFAFKKIFQQSLFTSIVKALAIYCIGLLQFCLFIIILTYAILATLSLFGVSPIG